MDNFLQNSNEINIQGIVAIITFVSAVVSALVSGVLQIVTKILENSAAKTQMKLTNEHELKVMEKKNAQEIKIKQLDAYHTEEKEAFRLFIDYATLFLSDPESIDSGNNYMQMIRYMNLSLIYGDEEYRNSVRQFTIYGSEKEDFLIDVGLEKEKLEKVICEINRILKEGTET